MSTRPEGLLNGYQRKPFDPLSNAWKTNSTPNPKSQDTENFSPVGYSMTEPPEDGLWLYKIPGAYVHSPSLKRYAKIEIDEYDLWNYLGAHDQTCLSQILEAIRGNGNDEVPEGHRGDRHLCDICVLRKTKEQLRTELRTVVTAIYGSQEKS